MSILASMSSSISFLAVPALAYASDWRYLPKILPMVLIPLWQWLYRAPTADRLSFGTALLLYAVAKVSELHDHEIAEATGLLSGHTIKHLLATAAAAIIVARLTWRSRPAKA